MSEIRPTCPIGCLRHRRQPERPLLVEPPVQAAGGEPAHRRNLGAQRREACELGGLFDITGTYDYSLDSAESEWDLDTQFSNCAVPEATLDGNLSWSQSVNAAGDTAQTITGTLSLTAPEGSASCTFDLTIETSSSGIRYSGSVCGYDAEAELGF